MEINKENIPIFILLVLSILLTIYFAFKTDRYYKQAKEELKKVNESLLEAKKQTIDTQKDIENLEENMLNFKSELNLLYALRDSLVLSQKRKFAKDWETLQNIKVKQKTTQEKLNKLRENGKKFE